MCIHIFGGLCIYEKCRTDKSLLYFIHSIPMAARYKAWVCGWFLARIAGSNPSLDMDVRLFRVCVCVCVLCHVDVSTSGWSLVQRNPAGVVFPVSVILKRGKGRSWPGIASKHYRGKKCIIYLKLCICWCNKLSTVISEIQRMSNLRISYTVGLLSSLP